MQTKSLNEWQPTAATMGSNYVMPYTTGSTASAAHGPTSIQPEPHKLPGSEVPGFTDTGVTHFNGSINLAGTTS